MTQLSFLDEDPPAAMVWNGARTMAQARLDAFLPRAGKAYTLSRNYDLGVDNRDNISCLSPWIRHRALTETQVLRATLQRHSYSSAEKFIQEVFWRGYFKGWLEQHPTVWQAYSADVLAQFKALETTPDMRALYENAQAGTTGIACFDAWAAELVETGYLQNHARMWFASIWIFTLKLPWQLGADFFYRNLIDGDAAANTLSWRWVAGLHTKGKNYIARKVNIEKYTKGRFAPDDLAVHAPALTEPGLHALRPVSHSGSGEGLARYGLIITQEDCHVETLDLPTQPQAILGVTGAEPRSRLPNNDLVNAFSKAAVADAVIRGKAHFNCAGTARDQDDLATGLIAFARAHQLDVLVTAWLPIGPMRDRFERAMPAMRDAGVTLVQIRRAYDTACWPHATHGFFKLKDQIPTLINTLDLQPR